MSRSHNLPEHKYEPYSHAKTAACAKMERSGQHNQTLD